MIYTGLGRVGEIADVKANGGADVAEVYGSIDYNDPIFYRRKTLTGTSPLTFKGLGQPLKDYHIFGETIQDGTPSPDYPVDVQGVGERTENLFDKDSPDVVRGNSFNQSGNIVYNGLSAITGYIPIKPDTFYSMFPKNGTSGWYGVFYDSEKNQISTFNVSGGGDGTSGQYIYKSPSNASYARLSVLNTGYYARTMYVEGTEKLVLSNIIPYGYKIPVTIGNVTTPIYIGSDPLYRIGDNADEIDFANQRIIRRIKKLVLTGNEEITLSSIDDNRVVGLFAILNMGLDYSRTGYCNILQWKTSGTYSQSEYNRIVATARINFYLSLAKSILPEPTFDGFKSYLAAQYAAGTPVIIWYALAEPEIASVTIPQLATEVGDNTLTVDTIIKPSAVSITGHIKPTGYGQLLDVNDVDIQDSTGEPIYIQG